MDTTKIPTISQSLKIEEGRERVIFDRVTEYQEKEKSISDTIKRLMLDFDLDTKEVVLAAYYLGRLQDQQLVQESFTESLNKLLYQFR